MIRAKDPSNRRPDGHSAVKIVIVYEDRTAGLRAKGLADRVATAFCKKQESTLLLWRSELLDFPQIAAEAAQAAADANFIILSFARGGRIDYPQRRWLELALSLNPTTAVIGLFGCSGTDAPDVAGTRHYCASVCADHNVAFLTCTAVNPNVVKPSASARRFQRRRASYVTSNTID